MADSEKVVLPSGRAVSPPPEAIATKDQKTSADVEKVIAHSHDADEAMKAFAHGEVVEVDEATNKRLLRIIDWHLMPIMCVVYGINYLDKTTISYASIMGLKKDLKLKGDNYQWLGSMFYFGYIAWEYPTNRLLQRLPLAKYSAFNVFMWGTTLALFAATSNFAGAVAWYTKREQGARTGIWFSFNGFGQILGGLVAYGIAVGARKHGVSIAPWKIVFLVFGIFTACLGILFWFIMPDNQLNAKWLSQADRVLAVARVRENQQEAYQLKEALTDPLAWAFAFYALVADIPNGGITNFFSQLIVSFGYTPEQSLLYGTPGGAVEVFALIFSGWLGDKLRRRLLVSLGGITIAFLGIILIVALPLHNSSGRLAGYYMTQASPTPFVALLSLISTNIAGYTKKTTVAAMYLIAYCVGNIIGPQTFRPKDAPRYVPGEITIIVCYGLAILDVLFIHFWCVRQNKIKARKRQEPGYIKLENQEWLDLTDRENLEFEYSL